MSRRTDYVKAVRNYLRAVEARVDPKEKEEEKVVRVVLKKLKRKYLAEGDQQEAKDLWCLRQIMKIQRAYLDAFALLKEGQFYEAWCLLERCENSLIALRGQFDVDRGGDEYRLRFIEGRVKQFQSLFPYKLFLSPEFRIKGQLCSACGRRVSLRRQCGHLAGEVYNGELCTRIVTDANILSVSLVQSPRQKYSVMFTKDPRTGEQVDQYDYSILRYLMSALPAPFAAWSLEWTKRRHPHSKFRGVGVNDRCPCKSGKKYKQCCKTESGVLMDHIDFKFGFAPPKELPPIMYNY